jgi:hypothetical protein
MPPKGAASSESREAKPMPPKEAASSESREAKPLLPQGERNGAASSEGREAKPMPAAERKGSAGELVELTAGGIRGLTDAEWAAMGASTRQVKIVRAVADALCPVAALIEKSDDKELPTTLEDDLSTLAAVPGVGPWTLRALRLMHSEDDPTLFLSDDAFIASQMRSLYPEHRKRLRTPDGRASFAAEKWGQDRSRACILLWRLKPMGLDLIERRLFHELSRVSFF